MHKKYGFTLAEVLITLGIIGVVAAMTIPVLISNTNGAKYRSQFKKAVSTMNQAALMSEAQFGYNFASTTETCPEDKSIAGALHPEESMSFCAMLNGTLEGKMYYGKVSDIVVNKKKSFGPYVLNTKDTIPDNYTDYFAYALADGSIVAFHPDAMNCELPIGRRITQAMFTGNDNGVDLSHCVGFIDVNGPTLPNREVNCSTGVNSVDAGSNCIVENTANRLLDVFPVVFHDTTVEPASGAAQFVLDTSKI